VTADRNAPLPAEVAGYFTKGIPGRHQHIQMLSIRGPSFIDSFPNQEFVYELSLVGVDVVENAHVPVICLGPRSTQAVSPANSLNRSGALEKHGSPALRSIHSKQPDTGVGAVEGVAVDYTVY
jgi:hypothetical protein